MIYKTISVIISSLRLKNRTRPDKFIQKKLFPTHLTIPKSTTHPLQKINFFRPNYASTCKNLSLSSIKKHNLLN